MSVYQIQNGNTYELLPPGTSRAEALRKIEEASKADADSYVILRQWIAGKACFRFVADRRGASFAERQHAQLRARFAIPESRDEES